jgi:hypothetical protein
MKRTILPLLFSALLAQPVFAHDGHGKPHWGGVVADAEIFQAELVIQDGQAKLYLSLHADMLPVQGATGKLTLLSGHKKEELELKQVAYSVLGATTSFKSSKGVKAVAVVTMPGKGTGNMHFQMK